MHANLYCTSLSRVNLSEAILSDANLSGAVLDQAHLIEANLSGANLTGAAVTQESLKTAKSLEGAIGLDQIDETSAKYLEENTMPDGSIRE